MSLTITDQIIRSTDTRHNACRLWTEADPDANVWSVSWLPGRNLTRNQAITAMTLAEIAGRVPAEGEPAEYYRPLWGHIDSWASELGMSGPAAVAQASESPEDAAAQAEESR